jgi:hypothetical protein
MKNMERNSFGIYDHPMPFRKKAEMEMSIDEFESQLDEGAFLMDHNEAVMLGFIHPDHESDSVIAAIGGKA